MKFLIMSRIGDGLGLGLRLRENGHTVAAWIRGSRERQNYDGLIRKVDRWEDFLDKDTVVIFDNNGGGKTGDKLRAKGYHVFGGSMFHDTLEYDRGTAFALMEEVGIKVPPTKTFYDWEAGKQYAEKFPRRLVFKPSGDLTKNPALKSYVSSSSEDLIDMLDYFRTQAGSIPPDFELQEFIDGGVVISTEGWFNGEEFMTPFNHTVERKQLMDGNLGPSGGCSGNCVWAADVQRNHIIEQGIRLMEPTLRQFNFVGPIDLNTIVRHDGVWALEFTPRFGYDALPAFLELYQGDIGELLSSLARGEKPKEMVLKSGFGSALRVTTPPYPSEEFKPKGGVPIHGFERVDTPHLFFYEVKLDEKDRLVTSGSGGTVVTITSHGDSIPGSLWEPYNLAKKARIPDKQYRTDLIAQLDQDWDMFKTLVQNGSHT